MFCGVELTDFRVEEVDEGQEQSVIDGPYYPETLAQVLDTDRRDFYDDEVCDPAPVSTRGKAQDLEV